MPAKNDKPVTSNPVKRAMNSLKKLEPAVLNEAVNRSGLIYGILADEPSIVNAGATISDALAGQWTTRHRCNRETLTDLKSDHIYRICNPVGNTGPIDIYVDGVKQKKFLQPGECRDVEGKKIEIHQAYTDKTMYGTYEKLD